MPEVNHQVVVNSPLKTIVIHKGRMDVDSDSPYFNSSRAVLSEEVLSQAKKRAHVLLEMHKLEKQQPHSLITDSNLAKPQTVEKVTSCEKNSSSTAKKNSPIKLQYGRQPPQKHELITSEILNQHCKAQQNIRNLLKDGPWDKRKRPFNLDDFEYQKKKKQIEGYFIRTSRSIYSTQNEIKVMESWFKNNPNTNNPTEAKWLKKLGSRYIWLNKLMVELTAYGQWRWINRNGFIEIYQHVIALFDRLNVICSSCQIEVSKDFSENLTLLQDFINEENRQSIRAIKKNNDASGMKKMKSTQLLKTFPQQVAKVPLKSERKIQQNRQREALCLKKRQPVVKPGMMKLRENTSHLKRKVDMKEDSITNSKLILNDFFKSVMENLQMVNNEMKALRLGTSVEKEKAVKKNIPILRKTEQKTISKESPIMNDEIIMEFDKIDVKQNLKDICDRLEFLEKEENEIRHRWAGISYDEHKLHQTQLEEAPPTPEVIIVDKNHKAGESYNAANEANGGDVCNLVQVLRLSPEKVVSIQCNANKYKRFHGLQLQLKNCPIPFGEFDRICDEITEEVIDELADEMLQVPTAMIQDIFSTEFKEMDS